MLIFLAFRNLFRNFRRTLAILCTVALGSGALFSFDGFINGILHEYRDSTIHSHYGFGQIHTRGYRETVFEDPVKHWIPNGQELEQFLYNLEGIELAVPRANFSALLKHGGITVSGSGQGIIAEREADFFYGLSVEEGEALRDQPNGIFLGRGLADALKLHPGDTVSVMATSTKGVIKTAKFTVTGIFRTGSLDFDSRVFRVQLKDAQYLLKNAKVELVSLALTSLSDWEKVATAIETAFPGLEATPFDVLDKVYYSNSIAWLKAQFLVVQAIILSIVLLGIFNTISASILERKQEIGNLRANGESTFQVMQLIIAEGSLLAVIGSLLGMAGAYGFLYILVSNGLTMPPGPGMTRPFVVSFTFEWHMVLYTMTLSVVSAIIASFMAGIRVARMSIAKSLRSY